MYEEKQKKNTQDQKYAREFLTSNETNKTPTLGKKTK